MNYLKSVFQQNDEDWKLTIYVSFKYTRPRVDDLPIISDRTGLANDQIQRHIMESTKFISQSRKITIYKLTIIRCLVKTVRSPRCNWWWLGYTRIWLWIDCWHALAPTCVSLPIFCYFHGIISMVFPNCLSGCCGYSHYLLIEEYIIIYFDLKSHCGR